MYGDGCDLKRDRATFCIYSWVGFLARYSNTCQIWTALDYWLFSPNLNHRLYGLIGLFQMMTQYNHYSTASNNHNVSNDQRGSLVLTLSNDQTASNGPNG